MMLGLTHLPQNIGVISMTAASLSVMSGDDADAGTATEFTCQLGASCEGASCDTTRSAFTLRSAPLMVPGRKVARQAETAQLSMPEQVIEGRAIHQDKTVFWNNRVRNDTFDYAQPSDVSEFIVLEIDNAGRSILKITAANGTQPRILTGHCQKQETREGTG